VGGKPGGLGRNTLVRDGKEQPLPGKIQLQLRAGDRLRIESPGGGGYGHESREVEEVDKVEKVGKSKSERGAMTQ
jgi:N-methylhydantoinase B/oxoprolinase/acetone carboxylase alpha subunit